MTHSDASSPSRLVPDALLTTEQVAALLSIPVRTLTSWRRKSRLQGPRFVRLGGTVRYRRSDLDAWLDARVVGRRGAL